MKSEQASNHGLRGFRILLHLVRSNNSLLLYWQLVNTLLHSSLLHYVGNVGIGPVRFLGSVSLNFEVFSWHGVRTSALSCHHTLLSYLCYPHPTSTCCGGTPTPTPACCCGGGVPPPPPPPPAVPGRGRGRGRGGGHDRGHHGHGHQRRTPYSYHRVCQCYLFLLYCETVS